MPSYKIEVFTLKNSFTQTYHSDTESTEQDFMDILRGVVSGLNEGYIVMKDFHSKGQRQEMNIIPRERVEHIKVTPIVELESREPSYDQF